MKPLARLVMALLALFFALLGIVVSPGFGLVVLEQPRRYHYYYFQPETMGWPPAWLGGWQPWTYSIGCIVLTAIALFLAIRRR